MILDEVIPLAVKRAAPKCGLLARLGVLESRGMTHRFYSECTAKQKQQH